MNDPSRALDDGAIGVSYWLTAVRYRYVVIAVAVLVVLAVAVLAFTATPIYRSEVVMVSNLEQDSSRLSSLASQFGGLAALTGIDLGSDRGARQEALATLRSRAFNQQFIAEHDLLKELFWDKWDAGGNRWVLEEDETAPTLRKGFRRFSQDVMFVEEDVATGIIRVVVEWRDRELAAEWANQLVYEVNSLLREEAIADARSSIDYLNRELEKTSVLELRESIYRLIESQVQQAMVANVRADYAFKVIDPATISEPKEYVRPNRLLMIGLAIFFGPALGLAVALFIGFVQGLRALQGALGPS